MAKRKSRSKKNSRTEILVAIFTVIAIFSLVGIISYQPVADAFEGVVDDGSNVNNQSGSGNVIEGTSGESGIVLEDVSLIVRRPVEPIEGTELSTSTSDFEVVEE